MEERFTWEKTVAGLHVGGIVPIKWRGCSKGCLVFMDRDKADADVQPGYANSSRDTQMAVDDDVEMDDSVVQPVSLAQTGFGDQDFEDDA